MSGVACVVEHGLEAIQSMHARHCTGTLIHQVEAPVPPAGLEPRAVAFMHSQPAVNLAAHGARIACWIAAIDEVELEVVGQPGEVAPAKWEHVVVVARGTDVRESHRLRLLVQWAEAVEAERGASRGRRKMSE